MQVRDVVLKALEESRQSKVIGTSLEAKVRLTGAGIDEYAKDLPALFITSQVVLEAGTELRVTIEKADGHKCERCWKYATDIASDQKYPSVCGPCAAALRDMLG